MIIVAGDSNHDPKYSGYRKNNITVWTDKLNVKVDNIAESGVGNDVICDNTLKAIREHDYKVDHVYVFWSDWYRVYKEQNRNHDVEAYRKWQTDIVHGRLNADLETLINLNLKTFYTLQTALKESNIDFSVIEGYRSKEEQKALYEQGKSELDGISSISAHQMGYAVDVLPYVIDSNGSILDCWNYNNPKVGAAWLEVYRAFLRESRLMSLTLELGLTYNINGMIDYPHIEIKD